MQQILGSGWVGGSINFLVTKEVKCLRLQEGNRPYPIEIRGWHLGRGTSIVGSTLERPRRSPGLEPSHPDLVHSVTAGVDLAQLAEGLDCFVLVVSWLGDRLWVAGKNLG